ncbi:hypothetical protein E2C01_091402 [Portunus trituberculatus]|uniref:Uncharacterized protein n=1 Tax=Portunus trituberculatus TaxID=210409 RepID=A0A5B7JHE8_PORTR|nr:hypothetical protein [Portunus trituberculatus]
MNKFHKRMNKKRGRRENEQSEWWRPYDKKKNYKTRAAQSGLACPPDLNTTTQPRSFPYVSPAQPSPAAQYTAPLPSLPPTPTQHLQRTLNVQLPRHSCLLPSKRGIHSGKLHFPAEQLSRKFKAVTPLLYRQNITNLVKDLRIICVRD